MQKSNWFALGRLRYLFAKSIKRLKTRRSVYILSFLGTPCYAALNKRIKPNFTIWLMLMKRKEARSTIWLFRHEIDTHVYGNMAAVSSSAADAAMDIDVVANAFVKSYYSLFASKEKRISMQTLYVLDSLVHELEILLIFLVSNPLQCSLGSTRSLKASKKLWSFSRSEFVAEIIHSSFFFRVGFLCKRWITMYFQLILSHLAVVVCWFWSLYICHLVSCFVFFIAFLPGSCQNRWFGERLVFFAQLPFNSYR